MKKDVKKEKRLKGKTSKDLLILIIISIVLFVIGIIFIPVYKFALSIVVATIPYGYSLLDFLGKEKFQTFGQGAIIVSVIVRLVLGAFIGVVACPIKVGYSLMEDIQK